MDIVNAKFTGPDMTLIEYTIVNEDGNREGRFVTYDTGLEDCNKVLELYDPEKLAENYHKWNDDERRFRLAVEQLVSDELAGSREQPEEDQTEELSTALLGAVLNLTKDNDAEGLFKLKLDVFETKEMTACTDKELKSTIRRANTALKVLALYHTVFERGIADSPDE